MTHLVLPTDRTRTSVTSERPLDTSRPHSRARSAALASACALVVATTGSAAYAANTKPVKLGSAGSYVILTETGVTDVSASSVSGNVGVSPITGAADHLSCTEITGRVYSVDAAGPAPCNIANPAKLGVAISDMQTAYTDAAGRISTVKELNNGEIGGLTLVPAVLAGAPAFPCPPASPFRAMHTPSGFSRWRRI